MSAESRPVDEPLGTPRTARRWIAPAAGVWSGLVCVIGALWAAEVVASPFGVEDPRAGEVWSYFEGLESAPIGWATVALGLLGIATALAVWRFPDHRWPAVPAAGLSLVLLLVVPDVRVLQNFAYLFFGYTGLWDLALGAMMVSIIGGSLWALTAIAQLTRGRDVAALRGPRWAVPVTYAAAVFALPYPIVRASWALGIPLGVPDGYIDVFSPLERLGLGLVFGGLPVAGAVLTIGLVRPWGEVFPRWIPVLRGRPVPIWFAVVPGAWAAIMVMQAGLRVTTEVAGGLGEMSWDSWGTELPGLFFLPWGVALTVAVAAYAVRRFAAPSRASA